MTPEEIVAKAKKQREDREARAKHIQECLSEEMCADCGEELSTPDNALGMWRYCACGKVFTRASAYYGGWGDSTPEKMRDAQRDYRVKEKAKEKSDWWGVFAGVVIFLTILGLFFSPLLFL